MKKAIIFPFYNEGKRVDLSSLRNFIDAVDADVFFVNDGSTDNSSQLIHALMKNTKSKTRIIELTKNSGKTNAVRIAMLKSLEEGYDFVLTQDLDLPYSHQDANRVFNLIDSESVDIYSGARVRLAGIGTLRSPLRQWAGRIIATLIFAFYSKEFYDPQSPCKAYRLESIQNGLKEKFKSRWFGDVELLYRLRKMNLELKCKEFVLEEWHDKPHGKLAIRSIFKVALDLTKVRFTQFF